MKRCSKCGETKELSDFHTDPSKKDGLFWCCKSCRSVYSRELNKKDPVKRKRLNLKRQYGITLEEWKKMHTAQNNKCAICGEEKTLVVDHDHATGKVRKLLCQNCNSLIGKAYEKTNILQRAIEYLQGY